MISFRQLYQSIWLRFFRIAFPKKNLVFYCHGSFHIPHLEPIISHFSSLPNYTVYLVCPVEFDSAAFPGVTCLNRVLENLPKFLVLDILISTEVRSIPPYYFCGKSVYSGHGIGPKMNYQLSASLDYFDYVYSPCNFFHNEFVKKLPLEKLRNVGLPLLDKLDSSSEKKIILYTPSWCSDQQYISDIRGVMDLLSTLDDWRVIVSLHPRQDILEDPKIHSAPNIEYIQETEFGSSFDVLPHAILVVGEISSVMFEALAFDIPIVFDGNRNIYEYSCALGLLVSFEECCYTLHDILDNGMVEELVEIDVKRNKREVFSKLYLSNLGGATNVFVNEIRQL